MPKKPVNTLGRRLRECRGINPAKGIAEALGITQQTLTGYERGRAEPSCAMLAALATHYRVTSDYLLGLTDMPCKPMSRSDTVSILARMVEIESKAQEERQLLLRKLCQG